MSGIQNFLAPIIFGNRNTVIILLGLVLAWVIVWLFVARWRNIRLYRELAAAKSAGSGGARRYVTSAPEEAPVGSGALPPVKGGRSYARNLGTALQKAGVAPQIYSPPSPPGFAPQPTMGQPGPTYAPQNVPWAAPAAPQGSPWGGYPAGGGRGMPGQSPAPFYQPPQAPQGPMSQPIAPPPGVPGPFAPPVGSPFAPPAFSPVTSGPPAPAPSFAPPVVPSAPAAQAFGGNPTAMEPPAAEPAAEDAGRRGKPKRRRFNFNVLENLEKMVQSKMAEPAPSTGWTPPASPTAPTPATASAPPTASTPPSPLGSWTPPAAPIPATSWAPPGAPTTTPALPTPASVSTPEPAAVAEPASADEQVSAPAEKPRIEADFAPLRFGREVESKPEVQTESLPLQFGPEVEAQPEQPAAVEKEPEPEPEPEPVVAEAAASEPEPQPEPEPAPVPEARRSMRSMLFGEETAPTHEPEPSREPASSAHEAEPSAHEPEPAAEPAVSEAEPIAAEHPWATSVPEPVIEAPEEEKVRPWNRRPSWEPEPEIEVVATAEPAEVPAVPETPVAAGGDGPSAGTVVIIEDDPSAAIYYATLFRGNGYHVEVANDGVSGVDLCTRIQPQLIMLDVMMPRQNGILVLQTLRASDETKNTPVVVMSNFSEPTLIKRALQLGALEYVIKTQVEGPALLKALPRWMNREKAFAAA
jgi:CheY-like chemotaxis protein